MGEAARRQLASSLHGDVLLPDDAAYEATVCNWQGLVLKRPAVIVRCATAADVVRAVQFARERGVLVAVRAGGHSVSLDSTCDGGIVINLTRMKGLRVDPKRRVAHAESGVTAGELDRATCTLGLATTLGECPSVGIAGFTLGGGLGRLMSLHGAGCDNLLSAEVVTADGRQLIASATENEDLFWGIRGGGGNFGVVTALEYRLHPIGPVVAGTLRYPLAQTRHVLRVFRSYMRTAPDGLDALVDVGSGLHQYIPNASGPAVALTACCVDERRGAERTLASLRAAGRPQADTIRPMPYLATQALANLEPFSALPAAGYEGYLKCAFVTDLTDEAINLVVAYAARVPSPVWMISFDHYMHGEVCRVPRGSTAFNLRQAGYSVRVAALWQGSAAADASMVWVQGLCRALEPFSNRTIYANYLTDEGSAGVRAAFGPNYEGLVTLKNKYDPTNFFRLNPNIRPT